MLGCHRGNRQVLRVWGTLAFERETTQGQHGSGEAVESPTRETSFIPVADEAERRSGAGEIRRVNTAAKSPGPDRCHRTCQDSTFPAPAERSCQVRPGGWGEGGPQHPRGEGCCPLPREPAGKVLKVRRPETRGLPQTIRPSHRYREGHGDICKSPKILPATQNTQHEKRSGDTIFTRQSLGMLGGSERLQVAPDPSTTRGCQPALEDQSRCQNECGWKPPGGRSGRSSICLLMG